jgi:hypothetical protein
MFLPPFLLYKIIKGSADYFDSRMIRFLDFTSFSPDDYSFATPRSFQFARGAQVEDVVLTTDTPCWAE